MKTVRMKRLAAGLLALLLVLSLLPAVSAAGENDWAANIPAMLSAGPYVEGEVIAAVDPAYAGDFDLLVLMGLKEDLEGEDLMTVPEENASAGEAVLTLISRPGRTTEELLYALAGDERVAFAEPNYIVETPEPSDEEDLSAALEQAAGTASLQADEDPWAGIAHHESVADLTPFQWGQKAINTPYFGTTEGNMTGDPIVVAVLDGGVDFSHPDLAPVAFTFTEAQQEKLGCGEHGYSVFAEDGVPFIRPEDDNANHGTHVAGIIGAAWDGHGVSGVASNVQIISVQCLADGCVSTNAAFVKGFEFIRRAIEAGADIRLTNNSWGGESLVLSINAAVRALGKDYGVVSLFAAGNKGTDPRYDKNVIATYSDNPYVIVVGASDPEDALTDFSCYNDKLVTLAAPGLSIFSTVMPVNGDYRPDVTRGTDSFYEGFEEETVRVTVVQEGGESACAVTTDRALSGSHSLALTLDPDAMDDYDDRWNACWLELTLHGVKADPGEYLGLSILAPGDAQVTWHSWDKGGDGFIRGDYFVNANFWSSIWLDGPEGAADPETSDLTVFLFCVFEKGVDRIWLDSVGLGSERTPYGKMNGTSQATPMVTGAAAVLAAETDLTGADLADLIKSKVRHSDALTGKVAAGGVFDFDEAGAVPPDPAPRTKYPLYDTDLPLALYTGDPYAIEGSDLGNTLAPGPMAGLGDRLYYLPRDSIFTTGSDNADLHVMYECVHAFDLTEGTWEVLPKLPARLAYGSAVSMAAYQGKLAVMGQTYASAEAGTEEFVVFVFDPETGDWSPASAEGIEAGMKLVVLDGKLYLVGGGKAATEEQPLVPGVLRHYDFTAGAGEKVLDLEDYYIGTQQTAVHAGAIWIYDPSVYSMERVTAEGSEIITRPYGNVRLPDTDAPGGILLACDRGLLLAGLSSKSGQTDTWLLRDGEDAFVPLKRKTTNDRAFNLAGTVWQGKVYVLGSGAEEKDSRFFRANDVETLDAPRQTAEIHSVWPDWGAVTVTAACPEDGAVLYSAAYGEDGQMLDVSAQPVKSDGLFHAYTLTFDVENYSYAGVFLLDENARPLCEGI